MLITILFEVTCFFKLQNSITTHFISIQARPGGGGGGGGRLIAGCIFCLQVDGPISGVELLSRSFQFPVPEVSSEFGKFNITS